MNFLKSIFLKIINCGVDNTEPSDDYLPTLFLNKVLVVLSFILIPVIVFCIFFGVTNVIVTSIISILIFLFIMCCHYKKKYYWGRFIGVLILILTYAISGCFFLTSTEFFLPCLAIFCISIYKKDKLFNALGYLSLLLFLLVEFYIKIQDFSLSSNQVFMGLINLFIAFIIFSYSLWQLKLFYIRRNEKMALLNEQLGIEKKKLEVINQKLFETYSIMAHDIKSPVNNLMELIELIKGGDMPSNEISQNIAKAIADKVVNVNCSIDSILLWTKAELYSSDVKIEKITYQEIIANSLKLFKNQIEKKNNQLEVDLQEPVEVLGDKRQIQLVVNNLLQNAIKHSDANTLIKVQMSNTVFCITNQSEVLSNSDINAILNAVELKANFKNQPNNNGVGLGLLICTTLLKINGSELKIWCNEVDHTFNAAFELHPADSIDKITFN